MKWIDRWLYEKVRDMWDNRHKYDEATKDYVGRLEAKTMNIGAMIEKNAIEGEDRITFELSSAVGGKILNVRKYDTKTDRHQTQTYVIPTGEDLGERVARIINLEQYR